MDESAAPDSDNRPRKRSWQSTGSEGQGHHRLQAAEASRRIWGSQDRISPRLASHPPEMRPPPKTEDLLKTAKPKRLPIKKPKQVVGSRRSKSAEAPSGSAAVKPYERKLPEKRLLSNEELHAHWKEKRSGSSQDRVRPKTDSHIDELSRIYHWLRSAATRTKNSRPSCKTEASNAQGVNTTWRIASSSS